MKDPCSKAGEPAGDGRWCVCGCGALLEAVRGRYPPHERHKPDKYTDSKIKIYESVKAGRVRRGVGY